MKQQLIIYGLILVLGVVIGGGVVWYLVDEYAQEAEIRAEEKFNDLLEQEKSKYTVELTNLQTAKEELEELVITTQTQVDSLNTSISNRTKELNRLRKKYNDKVSEINGMSYNELTTFFSNRYGY